MSDAKWKLPGQIWIDPTTLKRGNGYFYFTEQDGAPCVKFVPADSLTRAREEAFDEALTALRENQERFVMNGGRSARDREAQRRQSIYVRGLDDARAAVEAARDSKEK